MPYMKRKRIPGLDFLYSEEHDRPERYEGLLHDYKEKDETDDLPTQPLLVATYYIYAIKEADSYRTTHITEHPKIIQRVTLDRRTGRKQVTNQLERKDNEFIFKVLVSVRWANPRYELLFQAGDKIFHKTYFSLVE